VQERQKMNGKPFIYAEGGFFMKVQEVREIAKKRGIAAGRMNKTELIRTIQRAEGNYDCFATPYRDECNQLECLWREDCGEVKRK